MAHFRPPTARSHSYAISAKNIRLWLLMASGVFASAQIGKAIVSLPLVRADLSFGFDIAGLLIGVFAILGASFGIGAGVIAQNIGARRSLVGGMTLIAVGNLVGSQVTTEWYLLATRIVEGLGFLGVVLTIPSLLATSVDRDRRDFVMALWGAYMPAGITLMMLTAPLISAVGWRQFWLINAGVAGSFAMFLPFAVPPQGLLEKRKARWREDVMSILSTPYCIVLALAFFAFSCQIFSMMFALPLIFTSVHGSSVGGAGLASAAMLTVSTIGHVSSSFLLRAGIPAWANIAAAFLIFGLCSFAVYATTAPLLAIMIFAAVALGIGGLAPGALYAAAPEAAPHIKSLPLMIGLLQQASNLGQFTGPLVVGLWAEHFGWGAVPAIIAPAALCGLFVSLLIRVQSGGRDLNRVSDKFSSAGASKVTRDAS